jgi:hypothetical protein
MLVDNGYSVEVLRILASFVETFGLTLHPFDLATNNVMAGRLEGARMDRRYQLSPAVTEPGISVLGGLQQGSRIQFGIASE